ncbi:MAG TPA: sialidase family protein, partial [Abditibacteriaceae bacterium]|nr:sialidase family protein [Abditibacteriaceae bacterium]
TALSGTNDMARQSLAFPGMCVLPNNRWLCGARGAPTKGGTAGQHAVLTWSDDEGQSWHEPIAPFTPPEIDGKPGLFRAVYCTTLSGNDVLATLMWTDHSDPSLPFFNEETEGILDSRIFFACSQDNGATWSEPWPLAFGPFDVPLATTGPTLILANGDWACQFEVNKYYYSTETWRHSSVLMFSNDGGQSWPEYSVVSNDPANRIFYWDQRPGVLADGSLLDLFWTYDNQAATYLNIHARESADHGRTWSPLWDTGVPGQPAPPVSLPAGGIAMVYVDRTAAPVIKVRTSRDNGHTWPDDTELILHQAATESQTWQKGKMQDAWAEMGKFSLGLPATALLPDGDVLVVYYAGPHNDQTDIHWLRLRA